MSLNYRQARIHGPLPQTKTYVMQQMQCNPCNATHAMQPMQCNPCNVTHEMQPMQCNPCNATLDWLALHLKIGSVYI